MLQPNTRFITLTVTLPGIKTLFRLDLIILHIINTLLSQCFTSSSPLNRFILTALSETTCLKQFHLHFEFRWRKLKCHYISKFCKSWAKQNLHFPFTLYFDAGRLSMCKMPFRYCFLLSVAP